MRKAYRFWAWKAERSAARSARLQGLYDAAMEQNKLELAERVNQQIAQEEEKYEAIVEKWMEIEDGLHGRSPDA